MRKLILIQLIAVAISTLGLAAPDMQQKLVQGKWKVVSTGADCISTGWVEDEYEPKQGRIINTSVVFESGRLNWGKLECISATYQSRKEELNFSDGSGCSASQATLPKGCDLLMSKLRNSQLTELKVTCKGSKLIPTRYFFLSDEYLLAIVDADFICLKRASNL